MSAPRVLVAHPSADLFGSDRMLLESVQGMLDAGEEVVVTLPSDGPLVRELERRGAGVRFCPTAVLRREFANPLGLLRLAGRALRALPAGVRLVREVRPDVVYVNTVTLPLWLVIARLLRRPAVVHVHEAERSAPSIVRRALATPLLLARTVIANSAYCVDVIAGSYPPLRRRAEVVQNGIEAPPGAAPARRMLGGEVRLAYVGRLSARKGVDVAIAAVEALRVEGLAATLDVVGTPAAGNETFADSLHEFVDAHGLQGAVHFLGYRDPIWPVLAHCDLLVVPSRMEEGFGNTAVEGVLAARPVVVSDTSGLQEATEGYAAVQRIAPVDTETLCEALHVMLDDWPAYRAAAERDRPAAIERHDPRRYRARIASITRRAAAASRRRARGAAIGAPSTPTVGP